jgi:hypothetical protein
MKNINYILVLITLISSCSTIKDISYDDDVYGDFNRPAIVGNATSDDFFENEDYYDENYAVKKTNTTYSDSTQKYSDTYNNYYYGGNVNNCGCNNSYDYNNNYCGNNFNYYNNNCNNNYGYNTTGWGMNSYYGWGNPYNNNFYDNGYYYQGGGNLNPNYNNWNNNNVYWIDNNNSTNYTGHQGGGISSGSSGTGGFGTTNTNNTDLYNLTTINIKSKPINTENGSSNDNTSLPIEANYSKNPFESTAPVAAQQFNNRVIHLNRKT